MEFRNIGKGTTFENNILVQSSCRILQSKKQIKKANAHLFGIHIGARCIWLHPLHPLFDCSSSVTPKQYHKILFSNDRLVSPTNNTNYSLNIRTILLKIGPIEPHSKDRDSRRRTASIHTFRELLYHTEHCQRPKSTQRPTMDTATLLAAYYILFEDDEDDDDTPQLSIEDKRRRDRRYPRKAVQF